MREAPHVLGIVMAGGEGKRLYPLTADRAKPAVPFGGAYRLIDFVLSNLVNARYLRICVLTQYKSHSLDRHISQNWRLSGLVREHINPGHAHLAQLAAVRPGRRVHHTRPGAAAARSALVHRQRRRDLPVDELDLR